LRPVLSVFERKNPFREQEVEHNAEDEAAIVVFGLGRFGNRLLEILKEQNHVSYLGIDFDPNVVHQLKAAGHPVYYGDIDDPDLPDRLALPSVKIIVNTVPDAELSQHLIRCIRARGYSGQIFTTANTAKDFERLSYFEDVEVLKPHAMAAQQFFNDFLK
jgi:voltage-gated potassium channel Kch